MPGPKELLALNLAAWNAHDQDRLTALKAPDHDLQGPGGMRGTTAAEMRQFNQVLFDAFPDVHARVVSEVADDTRVAIEFILSGTHRGALRTAALEIPPTGRRIALRYTSIYQVEGGLICSEHVYYDQFELLGQLGIGPGRPLPPTG